ncbi:hypothetical protein [Methanohalobium sp.]|uniref:hypothetical protein n=1 Tax=Methanohalobium sp. TaxID=2837493 RepID=UPI0025CD4F6C|nr:hypothetical protein [Methanohalobium sp.]
MSEFEQSPIDGQFKSFSRIDLIDGDKTYAEYDVNDQIVRQTVENTEFGNVVTIEVDGEQVEELSNANPEEVVTAMARNTISFAKQ